MHDERDGYSSLRPRGDLTNLMHDTEWRSTYTLHREFHDTLLQHYAGKFEQLAIEQEARATGQRRSSSCIKLVQPRRGPRRTRRPRSFVVRRQMRELSDTDGSRYVNSCTPKRTRLLSNDLCLVQITPFTSQEACRS